MMYEVFTINFTINVGIGVASIRPEGWTDASDAMYWYPTMSTDRYATYNNPLLF